MDELLTVQFSKFSVRENSSCFALEESLTNSVEVRKVLQNYGLARSGLNFSGVYFPQVGRHFKLDVSDMTVKTILNKVIKESPIAKIWLIKKYSHDQTLLSGLMLDTNISIRAMKARSLNRLAASNENGAN